MMPTSGQLAMQTTTRSPAARPAPRSPPDIRRTRSASSSPVHRVPSKYMTDPAAVRSQACSASRCKLFPVARVTAGTVTLASMLRCASA